MKKQWIKPAPLPVDDRWEEETLEEYARRTAVEQGKPLVSETPWR